MKHNLRINRLALHAIVLSLSAFALPATAAPVTFNINYTYGGTVPTASQAAVTAATAQTFANIGSWFDAVTPVTLNVNFNYLDQGDPNLLGSAGPAGQQVRDGFLIPNALDKFQYGAGTTVTSQYDLNVNMNAAQAWDFTFATPADPNQYSYAETLYHEGFHALGFLSSFQQDGSTLNTLPTRWDNQLEGFVGGTWQPMLSLTQSQRASVITSNNGYRFNGSQAVAAYGSPILLHAPAVFEPGSSNGSHIRVGQAGLEVMYAAGPPGRYLEPSLTEKRMLTDIGWRLSSPAVVPEAGSLALVLPALGLLGAVVVRRKGRFTK